MFRLKYVVTSDRFDEFFGQSGFYEFWFNEKRFGEIYSDDVIQKICPEDLYEWLDRLIMVSLYLNEKPYVLLNDIENLTVWLEFRRKEDRLFVSLIESEKWDGCLDIEFGLVGKRVPLGWENEEVSFRQFVAEIQDKVKMYVDYISMRDPNGKEVNALKNKLTKQKRAINT